MDFHLILCSHVIFSSGVIALCLWMPFGVKAEGKENGMTGKGKKSGKN